MSNLGQDRPYSSHVAKLSWIHLKLSRLEPPQVELD